MVCVILDISKVLMYNFYYKTMKEQYGEILNYYLVIQIVYVLKLKQMIYMKIWKTIKIYMIFQSIQKHIFYTMKQIKSGLESWKMKQNHTQIQESIGIRPKMYSIKTYVEKEIEEDTPEGVKTYIKKEMKEKSTSKVVKNV